MAWRGASVGRGSHGRLGAIGALVLGLSFAWPGAGHATGLNPRDATYRIAGHRVTLRDGRASAPAAPGAASQVVTTLVGQPAYGPLSAGSHPAWAVVLAQSTGGSGTFFYVAVLQVGSHGAYVQAADAVLLGDRIRLRSVVIARHEVIVRYLTHGLTEPMALSPTKRVVGRYRLVRGRLVAAPSAGHRG